MEIMQSICQEYWDCIKKKFGELPVPLSREDIKNSIVKYDIKKEIGYPGNPWQQMCCYQIAADDFDCDVARLTVLQLIGSRTLLTSTGNSLERKSDRAGSSLHGAPPLAIHK